MLKLSSVLGNSQRLDGGAMFGNAPRALWSRWLVPDEQGRVELACRCFLVEDGARKILIETGIGAFFEPELRERYGVLEERHVLLDSLRELGVDQRDIDVVVLSHLHFDHAGGLLAAHVHGKSPELLFPRARFVVSEAALARARSPHLRDRASFIPELPRLLAESGRLDVVASEAELNHSVGAKFHWFESFGHTPGMLHVHLVGARGRALFCADLVPGTPWVHLPVTMGYDRFPEQLIDEKARLFETLERERCYLLFTHDPSVAAARVAKDDRKRFGPLDPKPKIQGWDLDEHASPAA